MPRNIVSQSVYDAAMRFIKGEPLPGDVNLLEMWYAEQTARTYRDMALQVIQIASENGIERICRD